MAEPYQLIDQQTADVVIDRLRLATTFWQRLRGLQFRRALHWDEGLLIVPCRSIHTHWMWFSIDVAMLSRDGEVLALHHSVRPWRMVAGPKLTQAVLEVPAGLLVNRLSIGSRLIVSGVDGRADNGFLSAMTK